MPHADADAIPVVYIPRLIEDIRSAVRHKIREGKPKPDTIVLDRWHFDCLAAWAEEMKYADDASNGLSLDGMVIAPGDPETQPFVLTRRGE